MFRRATSVRTWPKGPHEWSGTTETYHWLEVSKDGFIGTSRLCESEAEAIEMQNYCGYGNRKRKTRSMLCSLGYIRMQADEDTFELFDPA